eukprot:TRINITY_DN1356_c0_g1_i1.p1 TRINITY_DN1356_c0_g1~~TRINITY_DN1356_c0_g1_i1.p1  ORF type:complete len:1082 (+),score=195.36 TRINITY_DN1356_c0_g1_i1:59-3304(+)
MLILDNDVWKSGPLLPTMLTTTIGAVPWVTVVVAAMLTGKGPFLPAAIAMFTLLAVILIITTCTMTTSKITPSSVEVAGVAILMLLIPLDWGLACQRTSNEGWPMALVTVMTMVSSGAREGVALGCLSTLAIWLILRTVEESFDIGLYAPYDYEASDRCGVDDVSMIKCSRGWEHFMVSIGTRLIPVVTCAAVCYGTAFNAKRTQQMQNTVSSTELIMWELVKFNLEGVDSITNFLTDDTYDPNLKLSITALVSTLKLYKSYLPQSVLMTDDTLIPSDIQLPDSLVNTYQSDGNRNNTRNEMYLTGEFEQAAMVAPPSPTLAKGPPPPLVPPPLVSPPSLGSVTKRSAPQLKSAASLRSGADLLDTGSCISDEKSVPMEAVWLNKPGFLRPKFATLLLIEIDIDLESCPVGGPGGLVNLFIKKTIETAKAFEGITLHVESNRILISWNTHKPHHQHAAAACGCALELHAALREADVNAWYGIAVTSGTFFVGSAGVKEQMAPVVVGQNTALLNGVIQLTRQIRTHILLLDKVYIAVRSLIDARPVDSIKSPDSFDTILIYELLGTKTQGALSARSTQLYVEAFSMLRQLRLLECKAKLVEYLATNAGDPQAVRMLRISSWLHTAPKRLAELRTGGYYRAQMSFWEDFEGNAEGVEHELHLAEPLNLDTPEESESASDTEGGSGITRIPSSHSSTTSHQHFHRKWSFKSGRSVRSGSGASVGRRPTTAADSSTGKLRQQLIEAQQLRQKQEEDDEPISPQQEREIPLQFSDTCDRKWFRSERRLGKGAFGDVWLGMSTSGGLVALKVMKLPAMPDDELTIPKSPASPNMGSLVSNNSNRSDIMQRRRSRRNQSRYGSPRNQVKELLQEVSMLETLRHDNVVGYLGSCVVGRHVLIVMEYLSGGSLAGMVQQFNKLPLPSIRRYTRDIVCGLTFLHDNDIVHRDLKPHNVLMTNEGECKLADFGTATLLSEVTSISPTHQGITGTPLYMAPEACGGVVNKSSDIWSLGIVVCQLFTGVVPYDLNSGEFVGQAFVYKLKTDKTLMPSIPTLPEDAEAFVRSCIVRDPEERAGARMLDSHPFILA